LTTEYTHEGGVNNNTYNWILTSLHLYEILVNWFSHEGFIDMVYLKLQLVGQVDIQFRLDLISDGLFEIAHVWWRFEHIILALAGAVLIGWFRL